MTLLLGANNAGKTSLYSPLLLLKQTIESARPETALLSQGPLYEAGRFRDFVRDHDTTLPVTFELELEGERRTWLSDDSDPMTPGAVEFTFVAGDERGGSSALKRYQLRDQRGKRMFSWSRDGQTTNVSGPIVPSPGRAGRPLGPVSSMLRQIRDQSPEHFMISGSPGLSGIGSLRDVKQEHRERISAWVDAGLRFFQIQIDVNAGIERTLSSVSYLSPLRALPGRTYRVSAEPPSNVGTAGQFAPEMLFRDKQEGDGQLVEAVNDFLVSCGYGGLLFKPGPDYDSFELLVRKTRQGGADSNLVDSGMGLSQLLPLITQSLIATERNNLALIQQPEIHLNPALQVRLMDHFTRQAAEGKRVLIETHSEHLLLRLRRLIAEGVIDVSDVAVFFADKSGGVTRVRPIDVSSTGSIERQEWPEGFFAEQLHDSLVLAREQARIARREAL
ncbi:AAA family ATPase [Nocardioides sp.]|uniref:AAA family ATPase n=1 Tax=Nocardioides sp. TaxID=35761 RepID=UPI003D14A3D4